MYKLPLTVVKSVKVKYMSNKSTSKSTVIFFEKSSNYLRNRYGSNRSTSVQGFFKTGIQGITNPCK
jgi:hypothetical protein